MCLPGVGMVAGLSMLSTAVGVVGSVVQAVGQQKAAKRSAKIAQQRGALAQVEERRKQRIRMGNSVAAASNSGFTVSSFDDTIDDQFKQGLKAENLVRFNTDAQVGGIKNQAAMAKSQAGFGIARQSIGLFGQAIKSSPGYVQGPVYGPPEATTFRPFGHSTGRRG